MSCAGTSRAAIKDLDKSAACRQPPSNTKPDDASANDGDFWFANAREAIRHDTAPFAGMTQTGSTGLISAANTAAPRAVCKNDGNLCAILQAQHGRAGPLREAKGQAAKVTVVSGPTNNLILRGAECPLLAQNGHDATEFQCPLLGVKRTLACVRKIDFL